MNLMRNRILIKNRVLTPHHPISRAPETPYSPVLLADCVGGYSDETREAMLDILSNYGRISDSQEFAKELSR